LPRRPSGFTDDAGYPVAGGHADDRGRVGGGHYDAPSTYTTPVRRGQPGHRGVPGDYSAPARYAAPADADDPATAAQPLVPYGYDGGWHEAGRGDGHRHGDPRHGADEPGYEGADFVSSEDDLDYAADAEPHEYGARRRHRDSVRTGGDSLRGLLGRKGVDAGRRAGRRVSGPSRRTMTIAAVTTGTIAASTAAFAGVNPGGSAVGGGSEASLIGSGGKTSTSLLNIAQTVADTEATATAVSITPDHNSVAPNSRVMLTVRAVQAGGAPLANQPVRVVVAIGTDWRTTAVLRTDANGQASIPAHLLTTTKVSVVFDGTGALRPALASATTVNVVVPRQPTTGGGGLNPAAVGLTNAPGSTIGSRAVYLASLQRGKPYVWGATGPYSFDCSGLVLYVYKQLGRYLPRTAEAQYQATTRIAQSAKQPGDLIFFGSPGDIYHVGIYAGNGYIWQAPQTGETVQLVPIWSSSYYVGRVL
jgi:cell wall-associated NlpC family hydrolase